MLLSFFTIKASGRRAARDLCLSPNVPPIAGLVIFGR